MGKILMGRISVKTIQEMKDKKLLEELRRQLCQTSFYLECWSLQLYIQLLLQNYLKFDNSFK